MMEEVLEIGSGRRDAVYGLCVGGIADKGLIDEFADRIELPDHHNKGDEEDRDQDFEYISQESPLVEEPVLIEES
jgi:hypothetical protein